MLFFIRYYLNTEDENDAAALAPSWKNRIVITGLFVWSSRQTGNNLNHSDQVWEGLRVKI